ncbi:hypothetical protein Ahy_A06g027683 [Arachis hypogaea]|uniref:Uncharacterized protein n=1 Tax=Arachis hypogaea TaxID=3818 RepID=A0A445CPG9_ARAHY|nr:hypothetical protein Ahy_A06g027683 [Arachis hypogaea]
MVTLEQWNKRRGNPTGYLSRLEKFIWERNNSWAAVNDTFFLTKDAFERHRVVFTVGTFIASVATDRIGYSLHHFHDEKVEQRLESIEKAMKHKHNLEYSKIKDIVGSGGLSVPTYATTAATTLIIGIVWLGMVRWELLCDKEVQKRADETARTD